MTGEGAVLPLSSCSIESRLNVSCGNTEPRGKRAILPKVPSVNRTGIKALEGDAFAKDDLVRFQHQMNLCH